ncbi:MAG TPA: M14 family metallopeptidase [Pyrinomonadaceae bacterium]|nr:M14 family metallopeptidase [Pyrinomonadaceae bacterium]
MARHRHVPVISLVFSSLFIAAQVFSAHGQQAARRVPAFQVPSPQSVLGFVPGDDRRIADWSQITDYFARLDKASDRLLVKTLGQSTLRRPLIVAIISARENILSLEKYKGIQQKLADPRIIQNEQERKRLQAEGKVVVAVSCSIHSTEIVASQMSMQLAYELATAQDAETREILQNTILLLLPSANPDGIDIVANWYRKQLGTAFEGTDPPQLYHHYAGHDNNRDWFMLNLKETKAVSGLFWKEWFPQIVYDLHQQSSNGSRFFTPPFYDPANPNIAPLILREVGLIGYKIAADLQAAGFKGVITNALFDTWWHGGLRTAPYYHHSIGILSEAAGARLMSPATVTREQLSSSNSRGLRNALEATTNFPDPWTGGEWHPRDILKMEATAVRSVLLLAARYRLNYLRNFHDLARQNVTAIEKANEPLAYLIPAGQGRDEAVARLIAVLVEQGIEVYRLDHELHAAYGPQMLQRTNSASEKLGSYRRLVAQTSSLHEVPAGSYIVFIRQPQAANVLTLFEPQIYPNRLTAQAEAERPYDVTGWTLSMQMGVDAPAVIAIQETVAERRLTLIVDPENVRRDLALAVTKTDESPIQNPIKQPVRLGVYKSWKSNADEGWTRYILDTFNVPYKSVTDNDVRQGELLSGYDVLLLPSQRAKDLVEGHPMGSYPAEFTGGLSGPGLGNLRRFVEGGGTLICFDAACEVPIKEFRLPITNVLAEVKSSEFYCPGSIVAIDVDNTQPIGRGMARTVNAYFANSSAYETTDRAVRVVARYARENVLRSGWLLGEDKLRGRIALAEVSVGKGRVVLFGFRPQHRGQTWGTFAFIWNAIAPH